MINNKKSWNRIFLGFGILTIISGILLIIEKDYLIGISGSFVGILLIVQNIKQIKNNE